MKTFKIFLAFILIGIYASAQEIKHGSINLSAPSTAPSNIILRKSNIHHLVEQKINPSSANQGLIKEVFPLPFTENINIEFISSEKQNLSIKIFDVLGNLQKEFMIEKAKNNFYQNLALKDLATGIYFLQVQLINSNLFSQAKLIKIN